MVKVVRKFKGVATVSFCGWDRLIKGLVASGELKLYKGESVNDIRIDDGGITFSIDHK